MTRSEFQRGPAQDHYHDTLGVDETTPSGGLPTTWAVDDRSISVDGRVDIYGYDVEFDNGQLLFGADSYAVISVGDTQVELTQDRLAFTAGESGFDLSQGGDRQTTLVISPDVPTGPSNGRLWLQINPGSGIGRLWIHGDGAWHRLLTDSPAYWGNLPQTDPAVFGELWVDPNADHVVKVSQG